MRQDAEQQRPERLPAPETSWKELSAKVLELQTRLEQVERENRLLRIGLERQAAGLDHFGQLVTEILESRIWQSLKYAGSLVLRANSWLGSKSPVPAAPPAVAVPPPSYDSWIAAREGQAPDPPPVKAAPLRLAVVVADNGLPPEAYNRTLRSLERQPRESWELLRLQEDGQASSLIQADCVLLLQAGDELAAQALADLADAFQADPEAAALYGDEDRIDAQGHRSQPFFKPDWSPDLLLSGNYVGSLVAVRRAWWQQLQRPTRAYDLLLALSERSAAVRRLPRILVHRPTDRRTDLAAERTALETHLARVAPGARLEQAPVPGHWRVRYPIPPGTAVSIIIPSGGKVELLERNLNELFARTDYPDYEVLIADNSTGSAIADLVTFWQTRDRPIRHMDWRGLPFNFSAICNEAARRCASPLFLFLNDDTSVIEPGWLTAMVELGLRPEVGAVGAKLLYPDDTIQHAGVVMGLFGHCGHAFKGLHGRERHYFDLPDLIRNVSAVTGACLLVRADVFWQVRGFDEERLPVDSNDVDLCLKIGQQGYRVLVTPYALLYHHESASRTLIDRMAHPVEQRTMRERWQHLMENDPFYSPHLTRTAEDFSLRAVEPAAP